MSPARKRSGGDDGGERWLTTYADAITLLMAFFVMLYAMSQVDTIKFQAFLRGLAEPFNNNAGQESLMDSQGAIVGDEGAQDPAPPVAPAQPPSLSVVEPQLPSETEPTEATSENPEEEASELPEDLEKIRAELESALTAAGLPNVADYRRDERGLVISIGTDDVLFELGSAVILGQGRGVIATIAPTLARYPNELFVEGHTDSVPLLRAGYTNWNLSTDRAVAVLTLLHADFGIAPTRLAAAGYGEFRPRFDNDTALHRSLNRRVEIVVVSDIE
jgi:chemotaxis protein MotB